MRATCLCLAALLTLALALLLAPGWQRAGVPDAHAQAAVSSESQNLLQVIPGPGGDAFAVVYDPESKHLAAYLIARDGIKLRGVREVRWDLLIQELSSLPVQGISVKDVKALVKQP